jgi:hypothetical protein
VTPPVFQADRWRRAGATPDELDALAARFETLAPGNAAAETQRIAAESDRMLAEKLEAWRTARGAVEGSETAAVDATAEEDDEVVSGAYGAYEDPSRPEDIARPVVK